jgi:LAO/AO transport system kinase
MAKDVDTLAAAVLRGDRRALARAITLVESTREDDRERAEALLERLTPKAGRSIRIGISGAPGVGKSTLIEALGLHLLNSGHRVAVLAVDPSSIRSGGSILGDKTRMAELARADGAFIRPSPAGGTLGGVARRTREAIPLCEAAGFDVILVETVGVGQSETAVSEMTDFFILLVQPGGGDELQGIKKGIMEIADLVLVTKSDGDLAAAAKRAVADYRHALRLVRPERSGWTPTAEACSAATGAGIAEAWGIVERFRRKTGEKALGRRRAEQAVSHLWREVNELLRSRIARRPRLARAAAELERRVVAGDLAPGQAARRLVEEAFPEASDREPGA